MMFTASSSSNELNSHVIFVGICKHFWCVLDKHVYIYSVPVFDSTLHVKHVDIKECLYAVTVQPMIAALTIQTDVH